MIAYLLKSATCLGLFLVFYHLVLEKEKMHNFNRFYLLGSILFSFLAPLYTIYIDVEPIIFEQIATSNTFLPTENINSEIVMEEPVNYTFILMSIYGFISSILLIRFGRNLYKIILKTKNNTTIKYQKANLVLVDDNILPHTFWNYIFINKDDYQNKKIEKELFTHELTHVTQKHTLDILLLELLQILFWINPFFIVLKKAIQLNHEFLADESVINQHKNTFQYQHLLLNKAAWKNEYYLASNLNYSLTKKRLKMMTTQSSPTKILLKKLAIIPLLIGFIFLFAERVEAQEEIIETIYEQPNNDEKLEESEIYKEYFFKDLKILSKDKNGNKVSRKYTELSKKEKAQLKAKSLIIKKEIPSKKTFKKLKNSKLYSIWIDGKAVNNNVLNEYENDDFYNNSISFVHKNARSKKFHQKYQAHLYTKKYVKKQNEKNFNDYHNYLKKIYNIKEIEEEATQKQIEEYNKIAKKFNKDPEGIFKQKDITRLEYLYSLLSDKQKKNAEPYPKSILVFPTKKNNLKIPPPPIPANATKDQKKKYKAAINNYNKKNSKKVIDKQEKPKFHKNWFITIDGEKYYYTFDKNERVARYYKNNKLVDLDIVKEYNKKHKTFENLKNTGKHYVFKTKEAQKEIDKEWSDLGGMYFRMPRTDKNKVSRPINPKKPYITLRKNNKVFYKLRKDLTAEDKLLIPPPPPVPNATKEEIIKAKEAYKAWKKRTGNDFAPPPPPRNHLDQVIKMAKKGAKFYFEKEPISSEKAIDMLKKNKKLNIHSESTNNSNYKVWISKNAIKK